MTKQTHILSEVEKMQKYLNLAVENGDIAVWGYDVKKDRMYNISGDIFVKDGLSLEVASEEVYPDDREAVGAVMMKMMRGESSKEHIVLRYRNYHTGVYERIEKEITTILDADGKVDQIIGTHRDVSKEFAYHAEKEKYISALSLAVKASDMHIHYYDIKEDKFFLWKDGMFVEAKYNLSSIWEQVHPEERAKFQQLYENLIAGVQNSLYKTFRIYSKGLGEYHYYEMRFFSQKNADGKVFRISGSQKDVTSTMRLNHNLEESIERNRLIMNNISSGIVFLDKNFRVQWENMHEVFGLAAKGMYTQGELCYHGFGFDEPCPNCPALQSFKVKCKSSYKFKMGKKRTFESVSNPVFDEDGDVSGVVLKIEDVTQREEMMKRLKEADKQKTAFVANMSHEIRNPINAIVGFSQLMKDAETQEERDEYYAIVKKNSDMMLEIVNSILDISKIESGVIELKNDKFDMADFMKNAYPSLKQHCPSPAVKMECVSPYDSCIISMDKVRLMQIINNFVTNACKFTSKGHITVGYEYVDGGVRMYCEDTGMGMTEEEKEKVFDRFFKTTVNNPNGTGLGMPICKAIMDAKNGKIGVDSEKGVGSTFWVWFPSPRY